LDCGYEQDARTSGGNLSIINKISEICKKNGASIHLITMPPRDLSLINELKNLNVKLVFDPEVFDPSLFDLFLPGKSKNYGRDNYFKALQHSASVLGKGRAYVGLIAGLESLKSLINGIDFFYYTLGVIPAINIFHPDPSTALENFIRPSASFIMDVVKKMSEIYADDDINTPFLPYAGRNAIDSEAYELGKIISPNLVQ
jgi:biotin synthase-related radical SAM superfamily protein